MRLDKLLSVTGTATRSEAARAIRSRRVTVNGFAARRGDMQVNPESDRVTLDGEPVEYREFTYIMLNKPEGCVSATDDRNIPTVIGLLPDNLRRLGLFPCGRLDRDTVGLMLLTDDGSLSHFLLSPVSHVSKTYFFRCGKPLTAEDIGVLTAGVDIGDGKPTKPAELLCDGENESGRITLSEGRYHQIKRMFEAVGNNITFLERVSFGPLTLDTALGRGEWRRLTGDEIAALRKYNRNTNGDKS